MQELVNQDILFCKLYAETVNGAESIRQAYAGRYAESYVLGPKLQKLKSNSRIQEKKTERIWYE